LTHFGMHKNFHISAVSWEWLFTAFSYVLCSELSGHWGCSCIVCFLHNIFIPCIVRLIISNELQVSVSKDVTK